MATSKPVYICKLFYDFRRAWIIEWHWTNSLSSKSNKEIQNNHNQFIEQTDKKNRLIIKGVLEDTEILTRPEDKYTQHYSKFGFESYK